MKAWKKSIDNRINIWYYYIRPIPMKKGMMFLRELPKPKKRMIYSFKGTVAELGKDLQWFKEFMEFVGEQEQKLLIEKLKNFKGVDINGF